MRDLGIVQPGSVLYIPFHTFDSNDPTASVTLTGLATSDIEIFKDGSVTQRASDAGYALLDTDGIDFDSITGIHGISIDLADNTTAGFYAAGSQYWIVIASVTVDAATVNFVLCTFRIGQPGAVLNTTIASLSSQTSFTLTAGPAEDDALNGCVVRIHDVASAVQAGFAVVSDYTGSTKTVTLAAGTTFTAAATDNISFFPPALVPTTLGRTLDVSAGGEAGVDWANVGTPGSTVSLSATTVATVTTTGTATNVTTVNGLAANVITAASMAADASAEIADAVWDEDATGHQTQGTFGQAIGDPAADANTIYGAVVTGAAGATVAADIIAIKAETADILTDTAEIGAAGAGLTNINLPNQTMDIVGNITGNLSGTVGSVTGAVGSVTGAVGSVGTGGISEASFATTAGTFAPLNVVDQGTAQSATGTTLVLRAAAGFADDELVGARVLVTGGSAGVGQSRLITDYVGATDTATVSAWTTTPSGTITYKIFGDTAAAGGSAPTAAEVADAVWDEAQAGHVAAGSFGEIASEIADILTDTGTTLQGELDGIQADTEDIQGRLPAALTADGNIKADALRISGDATAADNAELFFDGTGYNAANSTVGTVTLVGTLTTYTGNTPQTGDSYAIVNSGTHGNAAIKGFVDDIGVAGAGLTAVPWNAAWDAEVQSEVEDAIVANNLDHLVLGAVDTDFATTVHVDSVLGQMAQTADGGFSRATDSLEAVRDRGDAAWATATGFSTHSAADVWASGTRVLTAGTNIQLPSNGLANVTAWTVALTGNVTGNLSGSVGSVTGAINTAAGVITTLDALDTAQDAQHATTQTVVGDVPTNAELATALDALPTAAENATAILAAGDVDGYSLEETLKLCLAALAGKISGAATATVTIRAADDSKTRITATVDADGNRSAVTLDETG